MRFAFSKVINLSLKLQGQIIFIVFKFEKSLKKPFIGKIWSKSLRFLFYLEIFLTQTISMW